MLRRPGRVLATVALLTAGVALVSTGGVDAGVPINGPTLRIHKEVVGESTTGFTVLVGCLQGSVPDGVPTVELSFLADGTPDPSAGAPMGWSASGGDWVLRDYALRGDACTATETNQGAATSVAYSCAYAEVAPTGEVVPAIPTTGCPGAGSGPSAAPATVTFPETCVAAECHLIAATLTVANAMPTITVGPTASVPGGTVTISGTGCAVTVLPTGGASASALPLGVVTGTVGFTPPLAFGPVTAAADGSWSTTIVVPPGTPAGTYAVNASCSLPVPDLAASDKVSAQAVGPFAYPTRSLVIAVAAAPKFTG